MAIAYNLYLEPREEDLKTGLWCPKCLKPSGVEIPIDIITNSGVSQSAITLRKCFDCGAPLPIDGSG